MVEAGRANADDRAPIVPPPPELWSRIEAGLTAAPRGRAVPRSAWAVAAAVIAVALVAVGLGRLRGPSIAATASLEPLVEGAQGTAVLVEDRRGLAVRIDDAALGTVDGYYEVWLADPTVQRLVSLGPYVEGEPKRLPEGLDIADYPVVDVSAEPLDGDPAHSGDSVLRGELPAG